MSSVPERAAGESQLTPETPASPPPSPLSLGDSDPRHDECRVYRERECGPGTPDTQGCLCISHCGSAPSEGSNSAQPAASQPTNEAWTNITAGVGGGLVTVLQDGHGPANAPETSKWVSAPGRREHKALAFLRRRWGYYGITERGYWVRLSEKPSRLKRVRLGQ